MPSGGPVYASPPLGAIKLPTGRGLALRERARQFGYGTGELGSPAPHVGGFAALLAWHGMRCNLFAAQRTRASNIVAAGAHVQEA